MKVFRQGDVLLVPIDEIPKNAKKAEDCVIALGEATGHRHQFLSGAVQFIHQLNEQTLERYVHVKDKVACLVHEEHSTLSIPTGDYGVIIQKEYTPGALRDVMD